MRVLAADAAVTVPVADAAVRAEVPPGLDGLRAAIRRDLERLNHPPANWPLGLTGPGGEAVLDVLVVGAGMFGQTLAFALQREGIRHVRVVDRAARGEEGPWGTYARMHTLRSPKALNGPDLGVPSLTFRAFHEALHGAEGWDGLYKIGRLDWRDYLLFLRDALGIAVENGTALASLAPEGGLLRAGLLGPGGPESLLARQVVLASGRDGSGGWNLPRFPSLPDLAAGRGRVFHSAELLDPARFRGRRLAVLGANASAFDNAAVALEAGAASVTLFSRRRFLPQVNKTRGMSPGFLRAFPGLDDAARWGFLTYLAGESSPPPHESVLRCRKHDNFDLRFDAGWRDVAADADGLRVDAGRGWEAFDAAILATGFAVDVSRRPELAAFRDRMLFWGDRVPAEAARRHPDLARYPYLGPGFELLPRDPGGDPALSRVRVFNPGAAVSHGILAGDIPGLAIGATRLAQHLGPALFAEELPRHREAIERFEEPELLPTPYFVPREARLRPRSDPP